jgi:hypothetical protein
MPAPPQRDQDGNIVPHDHPDIFEDFHVIRHIVPNDLHLDLSTGLYRVGSGAYSESNDPSGGMSVDVEEWMAADGLGPLSYLRSSDEGAVQLSVDSLRKAGFQVGWDPQPSNPHHGAVWGIGNGSKRKRRVAAMAITIRKAAGES